jgi:hypothetical protein
VVIDGVFDAAAAGGVIFRAATGVGAHAIAQVQERPFSMRLGRWNTRLYLCARR